VTSGIDVSLHSAIDTFHPPGDGAPQADADDAADPDDERPDDW